MRYMIIFIASILDKNNSAKFQNSIQWILQLLFKKAQLSKPLRSEIKYSAFALTTNVIELRILPFHCQTTNIHTLNQSHLADQKMRRFIIFHVLFLLRLFKVGPNRNYHYSLHMDRIQRMTVILNNIELIYHRINHFLNISRITSKPGWRTEWLILMDSSLNTSSITKDCNHNT